MLGKRMVVIAMLMAKSARGGGDGPLYGMEERKKRCGSNSRERNTMTVGAIMAIYPVCKHRCVHESHERGEENQDKLAVPPIRRRFGRPWGARGAARGAALGRESTEGGEGDKAGTR